VEKSVSEYDGFVIDDNSEVQKHVIHSIYQNDEYGAKNWLYDGLCIDVGANIGTFSRLWHNLNPTATIVSIEQCNHTVQLLRQNVGSFATVVHATCAYFEGWEPQTFNSEGLPRHRVTLQDVMGGERYISMLKLDCEGFERNILASMGEELLSRTRVIVGEYHGCNGHEFYAKCANWCPEFYCTCRDDLHHFTLYNPYWWFRKECGQ
jgi:FkbM family methyltransferase